MKSMSAIGKILKRGSLAISLLVLQTTGGRAATSIVQMVDFAFNPTTINISPGDTITWTNTTPTQHDTVSFSNLWRSSLLARGQTFSFTFANAGNFPYFCSPHLNLGMTGLVVVATSSGNMPPAVGI